MFHPDRQSYQIQSGFVTIKQNVITITKILRDKLFNVYNTLAYVKSDKGCCFEN